jgi:hypothetical protein
MAKVAAFARGAWGDLAEPTDASTCEEKTSK